MKEVDGECEEDYVQFGRDILFITSHRSNKFCGNIEVTLLNHVNSSVDMYKCTFLLLKGSPVVPPISMSSNVSSEDSWAAKGANITPLGMNEYGN
mgnify:FL=1